MANYTIREIQPGDNETLATIVRNTLAEFGANHPGTVYYDPSTDYLYELFQTKRAVYFVALLENGIAGGGGIFPTEGLPEDTCELVKMYLSPAARGIGLGKALIEKCLAWAKKNGFQKVYLESMPELTKALVVYEKMGFRYLPSSMGNTGHYGCTRWMLKEL